MSELKPCPFCGKAIAPGDISRRNTRAAEQERDQLREELTATRRELEELRELVRRGKWMGVYMEPEGEKHLLGFGPDTHRRLMEKVNDD